MTTMDWILFALVFVAILLWYIFKAVGEGVDALKALQMEVRKLSYRQMPEEWDPNWDDKPSLIEGVDRIQGQLDRVLSAVEKGR